MQVPVAKEPPPQSFCCKKDGGCYGVDTNKCDPADQHQESFPDIKSCVANCTAVPTPTPPPATVPDMGSIQIR